MVARLDAPQPVFTFPPADEIPDDFEDQAEPGLPLVSPWLIPLNNVDIAIGVLEKVWTF